MREKLKGVKLHVGFTMNVNVDFAYCFVNFKFVEEKRHNFNVRIYFNHKRKNKRNLKLKVPPEKDLLCHHFDVLEGSSFLQLLLHNSGIDIGDLLLLFVFFHKS